MIMKTEFDFDSVKKKMPYRVPTGFFDKMESDIYIHVVSNRAADKKQRNLRIIPSTIVSIAAIIVLC